MASLDRKERNSEMVLLIIEGKDRWRIKNVTIVVVEKAENKLT